MRKVNRKYVDSLINKMLNETLEERADELMSKIKTNVNELGGMEDDHPRFGKLNFSKMSPEEIEALMNDYVDSDDSEEKDDDFGTKRGRFFDDEDKGDDEWTEVDIDSDTELEEGFDDPYIERARGGKDYSHKEFKRIPKGAHIDMRNVRDDSVTPKRFMKNKFKDIDDLLKGLKGNDDEFDYNLDDDDLVTEMGKSLCECGSGLSEGECNECGSSYSSMEEGIYDVDDLDESNEFDYVEEGLLDNEGDEEFDHTEQGPNVEGCKAVMETIRKQGGRKTDLDLDLIERYQCETINENLTRKQRLRLDKNKNNRIDSEDFKLLRKGKKSETKEGSKPDFLDLDKDGNRKEPMKKAAKDAKKGKIKESIQLTEDEMIELIENIIKEEEKLKNIGGKPKGLSKYEEVHKKDGKENDEYLKSVAAKMKEYLKDGSKGDYEEMPEHFPKGNGQLAKMKAKKYTMSDDGNEFLNSYMRPGMEDLVPEEIEFDEDWVSDNIEGSSRTGNSPKYANAEETELGKNINKKRKEKKFHKAKETAYRKTRVPVSDGTGENSGSGIHIKESEIKETKVLNEEFSKIQHLMNYDRKTQ